MYYSHLVQTSVVLTLVGFSHCAKRWSIMTVALSVLSEAVARLRGAGKWLTQGSPRAVGHGSDLWKRLC